MNTLGPQKNQRKIKNLKKIKLFFKNPLTNEKKCDIISYVEARASNTNAAIAQSVERILGKDEVSGPNPDSSSRKKTVTKVTVFFQLNPPSSEEIHLRWMKSLRDEIPLVRGDEADLISSEAVG